MIIPPYKAVHVSLAFVCTSLSEVQIEKTLPFYWQLNGFVCVSLIDDVISTLLIPKVSVSPLEVKNLPSDAVTNPHVYEVFLGAVPQAK